MIPHSSRGFTLLIAIILSAVALAIGMAILDVAYKQSLLSSAAKQSEYAFYNADSAMECVLYWDQQGNGTGVSAFDYTTPLGSGSITCQSLAISGYTSTVSSPTRTTSFSIPCATGTGNSANATILKQSDGTTHIFVTGYNCTSGARTVERGLEAKYP